LLISRSAPFPYTTLFRSLLEQRGDVLRRQQRIVGQEPGPQHDARRRSCVGWILRLIEDGLELAQLGLDAEPRLRGLNALSRVAQDRKSTRLNSSHDQISY